MSGDDMFHASMRAAHDRAAIVEGSKSTREFIPSEPTKIRCCGRVAHQTEDLGPRVWHCRECSELWSGPDANELAYAVSALSRFVIEREAIPLTLHPVVRATVATLRKEQKPEAPPAPPPDRDPGTAVQL